MKIDNNTLANMEQDMKVIINHFNIDPKKLDVNGLNNVWFHTFINRSYNSDNPNVKTDKNGNRILSQIENYELYPCDTNDTTIYTALKIILKNLQK
jgi:hypothetical protein